MPPQRSAGVAAAAEPHATALAPLPLGLAQRIFVSLPADSRARACCVCPAWRDALAEPALWTRLDLSDESGVSFTLDVGALLRSVRCRTCGRAAAQSRHLLVCLA
jgi:hypothetical protein